MAKILIIDDDADLVETLSLLLERTGDDIVASRLSATPSTHWMDREVEAEHYVNKPIEPNELVRSIETMLRKAEVALRSLTFSTKKHTLTVMKKSLLRWLILLSFLLLLSQGVLVGADFPRPSGLINDFAGLIPQGDKQRMDMLAKEVLQKTGTSVVVATMQTIGDADVPTYANQLYQAWGIGKKGEDKGVLIFMALKERRIRIETGYGVEGILPDGLVGEILDKYAVPFLKRDQYGKGLYNALAAVSQVIAKDANVQLTGDVKVYRPTRRASRRIGLFPFLFFILILFSLLRRGRRGLLPLFILGSMGGRGGFGGGFGGFGGGFGGFGGGMSGGGGAGRGF